MKRMIVKLKMFFVTAVFAVALFGPNSHPLGKQMMRPIYPIEKVGVIARSVTFPTVLEHGQAIIEIEYPNASILCADVANYSGLVVGLIWSMDRALVEEYGLEHLVDQATIAFFTCVDMLIPPEVASLDHVSAVSARIKEETPAVSTEDAKKLIVAQIARIQAILRFAQTVKSRESE